MKDTVQEIIDRYFNRVEMKFSYAQYICQIILNHGYKITGICGGSASGKSTLATDLTKLLGSDKSVRIMVDGYLKYPREKMKEMGLTGYDSESRDMGRFVKDLVSLRQNRSIQKTIFDEITQRPAKALEEIHPQQFIILEDTIDFSEVADFTIFTYAPDEIMIRRRLARDLIGSTFWNRESLEQYIRTKSLPCYREKHLVVSAKCDLIVNTYTNEVFSKVKHKLRKSRYQL